MARRLALASCFAAVLAAAWMLARGPGREEPRAGQPESGARSAVGRTDPDVQVVAVSPRGSAGPDRTPGVLASAPERAVGGLAVRVVRAADGTPVAGAELLHLDEERADPVALPRFRREVATGFEEVARRFGGATRTDSRGVARIPWPAWKVRVGCGHGELWGELEITPGAEDEHELRLRPGRTLDVRVVDGEGRPVASVPLVLRSRLAGAPYVVGERRVAGRDGRARFERLQLAPEAAGLPLAHFVGLDLPAASPVQERIDLERWPEGPITLVHPETGRVEIELLSPDGTPAAIGGSVELTLGFDARYARALAGHDELRVGWSSELGRGRASFERVGLGLALSVYAWPHGWNAQPGDDFRGPTTPDETITVPVRLADPAPVLVGRAVDEAGRPLADRTLVCEFWPGNASWPWWTSGTRADGAGLFGGLGRGFLREQPAWSVFFRVHGTEPELARECALPSPVPDGVIDLGDVVLSAPPVIVSGAVVDPHGAALPGAHLRVERGGLDSTGRTETWSTLPGTRVTSDAAGTFSIRARTTGGRLRLQVERPGFIAPDPVPLPVLPAEERVTLLRGATLTARVIVPSRRARDWVELTLTSGARRPAGFVWRDDERIRWSGLPDGTYELRLRLWSDPFGVVHTLDGIVVRAGEEVRDERLDPLELARITHAHRVIVESGGSPVMDARLALRHGTDDWFELPLASEPGGRYTIHSFLDPLPSLRVRAPGCRETVVEDVSGELRVFLEPGLRVRLVAAEPLPVPESWDLVGVLGGDEDAGSSGTFTAAGEAEFHVSKPGRYGLLLLLRRNVDGKEWAQRSIGTFDAFFDVVETPDEQVFTIPPLTDWIRGQLLGHDER